MLDTYYKYNFLLYTFSKVKLEWNFPLDIFKINPSSNPKSHPGPAVSSQIVKQIIIIKYFNCTINLNIKDTILKSRIYIAKRRIIIKQ